MSKRAYATISIYGKSEDELLSIAAKLDIADYRLSDKKGVVGLHYSTIEEHTKSSIDEHISLLIGRLEKLPASLEELATRTATPIEVTLWLYIEFDQPNAGFNISKEMMAWLHEVGADVCIDVWR